MQTRTLAVCMYDEKLPSAASLCYKDAVQVTGSWDRKCTQEFYTPVEKERKGVCVLRHCSCTR